MIDDGIGWLGEAGLGSGASGLGVLLLIAATTYVLLRFGAVRLLRRLISLSGNRWAIILVERSVFRRLSAIPPALLLFIAIPELPGLSDGLVDALTRGTVGALVVLVVLTLYALLDGVNTAYSELPFAVDRPIKGYLQLVKLILAILAGVLVVSALADRSPGLLLSGIGAATAVLLLVFRDTILSLVASLQLTTNNMIRVGDWIELPSRGADGTVIDIALHTVKVRNFDNTIVSLPTHVLSAESFRNWRGMTESGGRRMMRAVLIDLTSVRFLSAEELDRFATWPLLQDHIREKRSELGVASDGHDPEDAATHGARRLTNLGVFRAYCEQYLRGEDAVHHDGMTLMVRQLAPSPEGLPIQLYAFTNTTDWVEYERVQADIFDHLLAILPRFGLRAYQRPSSGDLAALAPQQGVLVGSAAGAGNASPGAVIATG